MSKVLPLLCTLPAFACPRHSTGMTLKYVLQNEMIGWPSYIVQSKWCSTLSFADSSSARDLINCMHPYWPSRLGVNSAGGGWEGCRGGILLSLYESRLAFWSTFSERMVDVLCVGMCTLNQCH